MFVRMILAQTQAEMNAGQSITQSVELPARPIVGDTVTVDATIYNVTGVNMTDGASMLTAFGLMED